MKWYDISFHTVSVTDVLEGCTDSILDSMGKLSNKQKIEVGTYRAKKCHTCPIYIDGWCDNTITRPHKVTGEQVYGCGCKMVCKKFILDAECPAGEWKSVITKDV